MSRYRPAGISDEQSLLADLVDELVETRIGPAAETIATSGEIDPSLVAELAATELLAVDVPADLGGAGADLRAAVLTITGIARGSAALAAVPAISHASAAAVAAEAAAAGGEVEIGSTETAIADGSGGAVEAAASGDGWRVRGRVGRVEAPLLPRRLLLAFGTSKGPRAARLDVDAVGVELGPAQARTGLSGAPTRTLALDDVAIAADDLVGEAAVAAALSHRLLSSACRANGVARAALDAAVLYLDERRQFGVRLADMDGLRTIAAAAAARLQAAESAVWELAGHDDALRPANRGAIAAAAATATETAVTVSTEALQLHGGYGYTHDFPVERLFGDALSLRASVGGSRKTLGRAAEWLLGPAR